ncbi:unnamed protein product, partial [Prorocentrum cordatum]
VVWAFGGIRLGASLRAPAGALAERGGFSLQVVEEEVGEEGEDALRANCFNETGAASAWDRAGSRCVRAPPFSSVLMESCPRSTHCRGDGGVKLSMRPFNF